jgi:hypothetical protein
VTEVAAADFLYAGIYDCNPAQIRDVKHLDDKLRRMINEEVTIIQLHTGMTFKGKLAEKKIHGESWDPIKSKWWFGGPVNSSTSIWFESGVVKEIDDTTITIV